MDIRPGSVQVGADKTSRFRPDVSLLLVTFELLLFVQFYWTLYNLSIFLSVFCLLSIICNMTVLWIKLETSLDSTSKTKSIWTTFKGSVKCLIKNNYFVHSQVFWRPKLLTNLAITYGYSLRNNATAPTEHWQQWTRYAYLSVSDRGRRQLTDIVLKSVGERILHTLLSMTLLKQLILPFVSIYFCNILIQ